MGALGAWVMAALGAWMMIESGPARHQGTTSIVYFVVTKMKNIQKIVLPVFLILGMASITPVRAEGLMGNEACGAPHKHSDPVENVEKRLSALKAELKITGAQEQDWDIYAEKTKQNVRDIRDQMIGATHDKPQTAPERFDRHIALMKDRLASFEKMDDALKEFYRKLTPEQKVLADQHFARIHH